jgi:tetratricopeptide (TPR) repeat protein
MSRTRLSALFDGILEAGWLAAIVVTPLFFNIYSSRVFEPDKLTTLRSIALVMAAAWLVRLVEEWANSRRERGGAAPLVHVNWRTPLVLPTLFTVLVYLTSTFFSINRFVSFFGSYQRLQGTFTTLSYVIIFLIILDRMRTRAQVERFITTLILNSLPIALYGFVQHSERDPLPWGGDVTRRIASNMGNAIFVAAYLIMAVPPTLARVVASFRAILTDEETGVADVLRAAAYIFIVLVQVIAVWYTRSRGPLVGLLSGLGIWIFLGLLYLQRRAREEQEFRPGDLAKDLGRGFAFGLGSLAASGIVAALFFFAARAIAGPESSVPELGAMIAALLVLIGLWLAAIVNRRGWRWLWISTLALAAVFVVLFLAVNPGGPFHEWARTHPSIGRLSRVLEAGAGTGMVRALIWEGGIEMIMPHDPIEYPPTLTNPEWRPDSFNGIVRYLFGYGPESMYVGYNGFYPPLLGHYESRTASPDRSHNETLDSIIITGLAGFVAYVWLFGGVFTLGLRWLGFLPRDWRRTLFFVLMAAMAAIAVVATGLILGPHFFGLAIPAGMIAGVFVYLLVYGFSMYWESNAPAPSHPHLVLLIGIVSTFVAHFMEVNFGIAIASTRTTFWALAGVFVLLGLQRIVEREEEPQPAAAQTGQDAGGKRRKRRRRAAAPPPRKAPASSVPNWLWPSLGAALIGALILGTLSYDFVNNVERLSDPASIWWRSLTVIATPASQPARTSLGIFMVFALAWLMTALLSVAQMIKRGAFRARRGDEWIAVLIILLVSMGVGIAFGLALAGRHASVISTPVQSVSDVLRLAQRVANQLSAYYVFLACVILLGGLALAGERALPKRWGTPVGAMSLLAALVSWLVLPLVAGGGEVVRPFTLFLAAAVGLGLTALVGLLMFLLAPQSMESATEGGWAWAGAVAAAVCLFLAPLLSYQYNLRPIQADTVYKQADPWDRDRQWQVAVPHYERAIEMAPYEDFYYLYLGRAYLEYSSSLEDAAQQDLALRQTEQILLQAQETNPLNTDHSANLARMYRRWADLPAGRANRQLLGDISSRYYEVATGLSPNNPILWNEWATLYHYTLGDDALYQESIEHSLDLDPGFDQTWLIISDIRVEQGDYEGAIEGYRAALDIKPNQPQVWLAMGELQARLGQNADALETAFDYLERWPTGADAWNMHRLAAIAYYQQGQLDQALAEAQIALQMAPAEQQPLVQQLILDMQPTTTPTETTP